VALQRTLDNFPTKLRDIYSQALERISDQEKENADLAKHVLLWLVFGREALSYRELQYALSLTLPGYPAGIDKDTLLSLCCGLVTVEAKSDLVRLVRKWFFDRHVRAPLMGISLRLHCPGCSSPPSEGTYPRPSRCAL
jgi:hypothetical protein